MLIIRLYKVLLTLLFPFLLLNLAIRKVKRKEIALSILNKLGIYPQQPVASAIWFHAASVGELKSLQPLLQHYSVQGEQVLITTGTISSYNVFLKMGLTGVTHCFLPLDIPFIIRRFLRYWRPKLAIFTESELWPSLLTEIACPKVLLNARISPKSTKKWKRFPSTIAYLLSRFDLILAGTKYDKARCEELGAAEVEYVGNLKYAAQKLYYNAHELNKAADSLGGRRILVFASTHRGEDKIFLQTAKKVEKEYQNLQTIIVPRHPERVGEIESICQNLGLSYTVRSRHKDDWTQAVYIANTIGELGLMYQLADVVIIGGSFEAKGGQNMLEPVKFGKPVIVGPHYENFQELMEELINDKAIVLVKDVNDLQNKITELLQDNLLREELQENAIAVVDRLENNVIDQIIEKLSNYL
jgi:3-deoxy-D-manno-octulosonic-acid transferase